VNLVSELAGRTFLVTGGNAGVGYATAIDLARRGGRVHIAGRSKSKGEAAVASIKAETGSDQVFLVLLDLANLDSVRAGAQAVLALGEPLHVLINNAGVGGQRGLTSDGFEIHFGVNHLGHFLLTQELLPLITESGPGARIVVVASDSHYQAKGIDFSQLRSRTKSITGLREYSVSKLANVLFSAELARRLAGTGVNTYCVHPGVVASEIWRRVPWPLRPLIKSRMLTITEGAQTSLYCATSPDVAGETGLYYEKSAVREPSKVAQPELAEELWAYSEKWISAS
jgi:NAD(P)-dependent dehydrogenase (short-subunit alcohol dehydrogenase family)